ncbi:MAG: hypothetical protein QXJ69_05395 [Desulfurococcaceae archaeon]
MVFQDPHTSLDPRMTIASILLEPIRYYNLKVGEEEEFLVKQMELVELERDTSTDILTNCLEDRSKELQYSEQ